MKITLGHLSPNYSFCIWNKWRFSWSRCGFLVGVPTREVRIIEEMRPLNEKNPCRAASHSREFSMPFSGYHQLFAPTSHPLTKRPLLFSPGRVINQVRWVRPNWQLGSSHRGFYSDRCFYSRARKYDGVFIFPLFLQSNNLGITVPRKFVTTEI